MNFEHLQQADLSRRAFLGASAGGIGQLALGSLLGGVAQAGRPALPHFPPRAKRVVCLFQSGGFSHVDLFDYKTNLTKRHGEEIPPSVKGDQRLTGMTSGQSAYPVVAPIAEGRQCGQSGAWVSNLLPHTQRIVDDICFVKSMHTEAINHDPAITFLNTGNQQPGYASLGAWVSYGLGSANQNLPTYVAMISQGSGKSPGSQFSLGCGAAAFCPRRTRAWDCGLAPIRSFTCKTRPA